jgi:hypothetical protein
VKQYLEQSQRPWVSLLAILPWMAVYELGTRGQFSALLNQWLGTGIAAAPGVSPEQLVAFDLLSRAFAGVGATSTWLPAALMVCCLVSWHLARRDAWSVRPGVLAGMVLEGLVLAVPIALIGAVLFRLIPLTSAHSTTDWLMLSIGAGVYEEFVFRLLYFALAHTLLSDVLKFKGLGVPVVIVTTSAVLFAAYHCLGSETFSWPAFVFRWVAGVMLGVIMLSRGFGVTVLSHVAYNLILVLLCRGVVFL